MFTSIFKRRVFVAFTLCYTILNCFAQNIKEPDFIGEIYLLTSDSTFIQLPKTPATIKAKNNKLSMVVSLATSVKSYMIVKGNSAETRVKSENAPIRFIIRSNNNDVLPTNIITILPFEVKKKERQFLLNKVSVLGGSSMESLDGIPYKYEKYGESSYMIILENIKAGEYGIMVTDSEDSSQSYMGFCCIGID